MSAGTEVTTTWVAVCPAEQIVPETGVCALVEGEQVAVFRLADGSVWALGNLDPFSGASVMARGIVGDRAGVPVVASPVYKQCFDLRTGACLDDPSVALPAHRTEVVEGVVLVAAQEGMAT
ncbi:MAG TPA: nitrite reductase small subunit NirD [Acidimicrobiales bacterium]|nr:nitrite reductase small subunit NirD [Acidimicrobiales bacterium]